MKKGKRLITLFAILLVLVVGATSLVACTDKKGKKMSAEDFTNMLNNGVEMSVKPSDGWYFNVDAKVSVTYEKDAVKSKYDLIVRGTLDTNPEAQDKHDNQIFLQLNETKGSDPTTTLLGLYYSEKECNTIGSYAENAPQLYVELGGKYKFAYDTYSIKKLIRDVTPPTDNAAGIGDDIKGLVPQIFTQLAVPKTYKIKKIDKKTVETTVDLDITRLIRESVDFEEMKNGKPTGKLVQGQGILYGLIKDNSEMIDGILGAGTTEKPGLGLDITADKLVNLDINMPMKLTCRYDSAKKGSFGKFQSAALNINIAKDHDITIKMGEEYLVSGDKNISAIIPFPTLIPQCNITIAVEKMEIASGEKLALEFPSPDGFTKVGIANIDISGKVRFGDNKTPNIKPGEAKGTEYDLIIKADINPIPLAFITSDTVVKQDVFEAIGMLHIAIITPDRSKALVQIVYDPNSTGGDYAYVDLGILSAKIGLRMDASSLEGLFNVMVDFVQGKYPKAAPVAAGILDTVDDGDTNNVAPDLGILIKDLCNETIKSIVDMIDPALWNKDIDGNPATEDSVGNTVKKVGKIVADLTATDPGAVKLGTVERKGQNNAFVELNIGTILATIAKEFHLDPGLVGTISGLIPTILPGDILNLEFTGISYGTVEASYDAAQFIKKGIGLGGAQVAKILGVPGADANGVLKISKAAFKAQYATFDPDMKTTIPLSCQLINDVNNKPGKIANKPYHVYFAQYDENSTAVQDVTIAVRSAEGNVGTLVGTIGGFLPPNTPITKYPLGFESVTFKVQLT